ncbi:uncharacterized protein LOC117111392 [Anneissia japonica]|uniref:uncharacterized protein LOC117111392 n=1 Tax=Anneissia japonica TaxID=1529436 RepID=UPI001425BB03|nr:uncharacterized protein LOC117111392 [Anneissia japonica]
METCVDEDKIMKRERTSPHGDGDAENLEQEVKLLTRAPSPKRVMRMYADDVEQQVKNIRKLSAPVGLQVVIEPDHHHTNNRIGGEMNNSGIIRRIGRHPQRGAFEGAKRSEHNLFPDLRGKLNNKKTGRRLLSENSNISVEIGDDLQ